MFIISYVMVYYALRYVWGTDVDECAVNNGGCSPHANCTNMPGMYTCTCIGGYFGDGFSCAGKARKYCHLW